MMYIYSLINRQFLDQYVKDKNGNSLPAIMMEETSHSVWVNSKAYEMAGISESVTNDVNRGMVYMRDSSGKLNGIVLENAAITMLENAFDPDVSYMMTLSEKVIYNGH
jgi:predicted amidohydrolase YtcJ